MARAEAEKATYDLYKKGEAKPSIRIEQILVFASSPPSSREACKRSERCESRCSSLSRQQSNRLHITLATWKTPRSAQYSYLALTKGKKKSLVQFMFQLLTHIRSISYNSTNTGLNVVQGTYLNNTGTVGVKRYASSKRARLQYWRPVRGEAYHVSSQPPTNVQEQLGRFSNQPFSSERETRKTKNGDS